MQKAECGERRLCVGARAAGKGQRTEARPLRFGRGDRGGEINAESGKEGCEARPGVNPETGKGGMRGETPPLRSG